MKKPSNTSLQLGVSAPDAAAALTSAGLRRCSSRSSCASDPGPGGTLPCSTRPTPSTDSASVSVAERLRPPRVQHVLSLREMLMLCDAS